MVTHRPANDFAGEKIEPDRATLPRLAHKLCRRAKPNWGARFANKLGGDLGPDADRCPAWPWPVDAAETRFIGEHDPQVTAWLSSQHLESHFLKAL
jgi:hypothetical protein